MVDVQQHQGRPEGECTFTRRFAIFGHMLDVLPVSVVEFITYRITVIDEILLTPHFAPISLLDFMKDW